MIEGKREREYEDAAILVGDWTWRTDAILYAKEVSGTVRYRTNPLDGGVLDFLSFFLFFFECVLDGGSWMVPPCRRIWPFSHPRRWWLLRGA